ncbi:MAG TPA: UdgX family uracil-DNA binding protein [Tepidisphaeraceae bacterium]|jgi:DNA polymerase|nr:UdgX family uracil-DNA binding protein [Tepidisphaeraceae bacterium]
MTEERVADIRAHAIKSSMAMKTQACNETGSAADFLPAAATLAALAVAAEKCHGCTLYCHATQVVFGSGPKNAKLMLIGEQPGDQEDLAGLPFVGPAGRVLDQALESAGIRRQDVYVTNAVKHFKFEPRGKRRLHKKPSGRETAACRPWLEAEIKVVKPRMIMCLGATAAQSLLGSSFRLTLHRREVIEDTPWAPALMASIHPSLLLRIPDAEQRHKAMADFIDDFKMAARRLKKVST